MSNPNAKAVAVTGAIVTGVEWLVANYGHVVLSGWWKNALTVGVLTAVVYVGKDGVKGAISRLWGGTKTVWIGKPVAKSKVVQVGNAQVGTDPGPSQ